MRSATLGLLTSVLLSNTSPTFSQSVSVNFVQPEHFTDASPYGGYGLKSEQPALIEIKRYIESLAVQFLSPGQRLAVDVLDIDLAGGFEPWSIAVNDIRILRDVYTPKIRVHYKLTEGEHTVSEGEETVTDGDYLANPAARPSREPLRYEKAMLEDWFQSRMR